MPTTPTYPGVYIEELQSDIRTIAGVSTSVAAFVGYFRRGPINTPVRIFSLADFEREFGGLDALSEAGYGIRQFFLNGGSQAWVVRVAAANPAAAAVVVKAGPAAGANTIFRAFAGQQVRGTSVANPGAWGNNIRLEIDDATSDPAEFFNLVVSEVTTSGGQTVTLRTEEFRNLTLRPGAATNVVSVVNERSKIVQLNRTGLTALPAPFVTTFRPAATGTVGAPLPATPTIPATASTFNVNPGTGALVCTLTYGGPAPADYASLRPFVEAAIRAAGSSPNPMSQALSGAVVQLVPTGIPATPFRFRVLAGRGGTFNPGTLLTFTNDGTDTTAAVLGLTASPNVQQYTLGAGTAGSQASPVPGTDGAVPDAPALIGVRSAKTGLYALEDVDLFNILCIPRAADLAPAAMATVYTEAEAYCLERRAVVLLDIPAATASPDAMLTWLSQNTALRSANAAVYFPRPRIPDPLNDFRLRSVGASGTLAGIFARTDSNRGVWKAPAGTEAGLRGVSELAYPLTDGENGALNPLGINCLRFFRTPGNVAWGARTLDGADELASQWKYLPVRRLALYLEESLFRGTQWVVFEPNDEPLWAQIRLNLGAFMQNLFLQGAFQGSTPREAYLVKCDAETTTQNDIDRGIVNIVVGFAPLKPAEFVIIQIQQLAGQTQA
jgi:phage tail sheath protein FI